VNVITANPFHFERKYRLSETSIYEYSSMVSHKSINPCTDSAIIIYYNPSFHPGYAILISPDSLIVFFRKRSVDSTSSAYGKFKCKDIIYKDSIIKRTKNPLANVDIFKELTKLGIDKMASIRPGIAIDDGASIGVEVYMYDKSNIFSYQVHKYRDKRYVLISKMVYRILSELGVEAEQELAGYGLND
jgi:hypothetical protein